MHLNICLGQHSRMILDLVSILVAIYILCIYMSLLDRVNCAFYKTENVFFRKHMLNFQLFSVIFNHDKEMITYGRFVKNNLDVG